MRIASALFVMAVAAGCSGGDLYMETDFIELKGFVLKVADKVDKSPGRIQAGQLEYEGEGDLNATYRLFVAEMVKHGWSSSQDNMSGDKATGVLSKDTRKCAWTFTNTNGKIRAVFAISQPK